MTTLFPIGTSRLHEPFSLLSEHRAEAVFPGAGYFHTAPQIGQFVNLLTGQMYLPPSMARYFFRRDQTPPNPFDARLLIDHHEEAIVAMRSKFARSDVIVIEVCSDRNFHCDGYYLQGNPNYRANVPYAEVWKDGYYVKYEPDVPVQVYESDEAETSASLDYIARSVIKAGKGVMFLSHLIPSTGANAQRLRLKQQVARFCGAFDDPRIQFYDQTHLVDRFGFRVLDNGTIDIFHLPWEALTHQAAEMAALAQRIASEASRPRLSTFAT